LWLVAAVSAGLAAVRVFLLVWHRSPLDFDIYMMGGSHFFGGHLYDVRYTSPQLGFTYPPFSALAFSPLTLLPRQLAQYLWAGANLALLAGLVAVSLRAARPALSGRRLIQWSLILLSPAIWLDPVKLTFSYGQVNIILVTLILTDLTGRVRLGDKVIPQGVLTGLAAAAKLTPLIFVPFLFLVRQGKAATATLVTFIGVGGVVALLGPSTSWTYWTRDAFDTGRVGANSYISNQNLSGSLERFHHSTVPHPVYYGIDLILAVGGMALAVWAYRQSSRLLGILVCATVGMVVSPITWAHHMVWVVPVLIWLCLAEDRPRGGRIWAAAAALLFWRAPIWSLPYGGSGQELHERGWQLVVGSSYFLAMIVFLLGVALMLLLRSRHTQSSTEPARPLDLAVSGAAGGRASLSLPSHRGG
jgi:alpha-1,2-mannosyltransferase